MVDIGSTPVTAPETALIALRIMAIATDAGIMDMTMYMDASLEETKAVVVYNGGQNVRETKEIEKRPSCYRHKPKTG